MERPNPTWSTKSDLDDQIGFGRLNPIWSTKSELVDQIRFGRPNPSWSITRCFYPLYLCRTTKSELVDQIRIGRPNPIWSTKSELVDQFGFCLFSRCFYPLYLRRTAKSDLVDQIRIGQSRFGRTHFNYQFPVPTLGRHDQFPFGRPIPFWSTNSLLVNQFPFGRPIPFWSTNSLLDRKSTRLNSSH